MLFVEKQLIKPMDLTTLRFEHLKKNPRISINRTIYSILPKQPIAIPSVFNQGNFSLSILDVINFNFAPNDLNYKCQNTKTK